MTIKQQLRVWPAHISAVNSCSAPMQHATPPSGYLDLYRACIIKKIGTERDSKQIAFNMPITLRIIPRPLLKLPSTPIACILPAVAARHLSRLGVQACSKMMGSHKDTVFCAQSICTLSGSRAATSSPMWSPSSPTKTGASSGTQGASRRPASPNASLDKESVPIWEVTCGRKARQNVSLPDTEAQYTQF